MMQTLPLPACRGRARLLIALAAALGCAGQRPSVIGEPVAAARPLPPDALQTVLAGARDSLGDPELDGRRLPTDCSGYVRALYARAGVDLFSEGRRADNGVRAIVRWVEIHGVLHRQKVPDPGDLVFFDNSYDRNGDGRLNDPLTHVGLVEEVLADGTALIVHATNHGIVREPMNLLRPHQTAGEDGRTINAPLRRKGRSDSPYTPHLMSELFAGFGRVLPQPGISRAAAPSPPSTRRASDPAGTG